MFSKVTPKDPWAEVEVETLLEADQISLWREDRLLRVGFSVPSAMRLAAARHVDLHAALELVKQGCAPELATNILL